MIVRHSERCNALEAAPDNSRWQDEDAWRSWDCIYEIVDQSDVGIKLDTESIPVNHEVAGSRACSG